ncbi:MAG: FG-GAP repeat protein [Rhodanobacteraceae bacterium]
MSSNPTTPATKVTASDGRANDWFGTAVAIVDDTAVVGAPNANVNGDVSRGAAYVFKRVSGIWRQAQKLIASDGASLDLFGQVVTLLDAKTLIIAAPFARVNGSTWVGAAYVFQFAGGTWVEKQKLTPSDLSPFGTFGKCVALNGTHLLIGAGGASMNNAHVRGSVYAFDFVPSPAGGSWIQVQRILAPDQNDDTAFFGNAVAISANTVLIGAYASTVDGTLGQGAVYVYNRFSGTWRMSEKLTASDGGARDNFGISIGFVGTTAAIGAPGATINGNISQGAVYRFKLAGSQSIEVQKLTAQDGTALNLFGAAVNLANSRVLVGAYAADNYRGAAYVFGTSTSGTMMQQRKLAPNDGLNFDVFGHFTALDAHTALVSAYAADIGSNPNQGAAYFFPLGPVGP